MAETMTDKAERRGIYLDRVKAFFEQVETWLPKKELETVNIPRSIHDKTGEYDAFGLAITKKDMLEADDAVADLFPQGSSILLGEGLIDLMGPFGEESIIYMLKDGLMIFDAQGRERPMFKGIAHDGWYWLEDARRNRALPLDSNLFMDLLAMVSDYEPA